MPYRYTTFYTIDAVRYGIIHAVRYGIIHADGMAVIPMRVGIIGVQYL